MKREWTPITEDQKDGRIYLLGIPDKKIGPWMGYFWNNGNCWLQCDLPAHGKMPTHYYDLTGLLFE